MLFWPKNLHIFVFFLQKCVKLRKGTTNFLYMQMKKFFFQKKEWRHFLPSPLRSL